MKGTHRFFLSASRRCAVIRDAAKKHPKTSNQWRKHMKTKDQEIKQTDVNQNTKPITGFNMSIMPVLSKNGEHVYFFLPGEISICEHSNRFKGLLGFPYTPKSPSEKSEFRPRLGLAAKVRVGLSQDGQWVTIYLPGNMGRISNHINAYKHIFKVPYEKKTRVAA
jgi:hypothetical protein